MTQRRTRVATYLLAMDAGSILLARIAPGYPGSGSWTLPGGGVEWGEHPESALRREVHEETSLVFGQATFVGIDSRVYASSGSHPPLHAIRLIYTAAVTGEPKVVEVDGSVDASEWIAVAQLGDVPTVDLVGAAIRMGAQLFE